MMSIGEVARRTSFRTSAIRYYERIGLLPPAARTSGRRRYDERVLLRLGVIRFARESGFALAEIRALLSGRPYSRGLRALAGRKIAELEDVVAQARRMQSLLAVALRCRCLTLERCGQVMMRTRRAAVPVEAPRSARRRPTR